MQRLVEDMKTLHVGRAALVLSDMATASGLNKAKAMGVKTKLIDHHSYEEDLRTFDETLHECLLAHSIDIICLAGFMRVLGKKFVREWEGRILNIHPSLLPKFKGLNTHQRAIDAGESLAGCSVHEVLAELDAGPILNQASLSILPDDTAVSLAARVLELEHQLYPVTLRSFLTRKTSRN